MTTTTKRLLVPLVLGLMLVGARAQDHAFTYQGYLTERGEPANGPYEFRFALYDAGTAGALEGGPITGPPVAVSDGRFTVQLDFGADPFDGEDRWLEVAVRPGGSQEPFVVLEPRQPLTAVPYALHAFEAGKLRGPLPDTQLTANIPRLDRAQTFSGTNTFSNPANRFTGAFTGNGGGLTNLNAAQLKGEVPSAALTAVPAGNLTGTVPDSRLPANLARLNAPAAFTGPVSFAAPVQFTNRDTVVAEPATERNRDVTFTAVPALPGNVPAVAVTVSDLNRDGHPDLVGANLFEHSLTVLTNDGAAAFARMMPDIPVGRWPTSVAVEDLNGDGRLDLISANAGANTLTVLTGNVAGGFDRMLPDLVAGEEPEFYQRMGMSVIAGDVNQDNRPDLVSANYLTSVITVLTNRGATRFARVLPDLPFEAASLLGGGDVSGDGRFDVVALNRDELSLSLLTNIGAGRFARTDVDLDAPPIAVATGDLNRDGALDLVINHVPHRDPSSGALHHKIGVMVNNGAGGYTWTNHDLQAVATAEQSIFGGASVAVGDLNGDGWLDIISADSGNRLLSVLTNNGAGGFAQVLPDIPTGSPAFSVAAVDLNGDERLDLVSAGNGISVLVGNPGPEIRTYASTFVGTFIGNGAGLSGSDGGNLSGGLIPDSRLPGNLARRDAHQSFSGQNTFSHAGNQFTGTFTGDGSGLTHLNAAELTGQIPGATLGAIQVGSLSGVLVETQLPANVARLNADQTLQGRTSFGSPVALHDHELYLREMGDANHGLSWHGPERPFGASTPDGPVLYGYAGGALGSTEGGPRAALTWDLHGRVVIDPAGSNPGELRSTGALVFGAGDSGEGIGSTRVTGPGQYGLDFYTASLRRMTIFVDGKVGIGETIPSEQLDVAGRVVLADSANASPKAGTLRWSGRDFEGFNGTRWVSLTADPALVTPVPNLVWIRPGSFTMGSSARVSGSRDDERPQSPVTITHGFWMGTFELTQEEYEALMGSNPSPVKNARSPVVSVSWVNAMEYCSRLTQRERAAGRIPGNWRYRLPTEAEWEYSARAGMATAYSYGDDPSVLQYYAWFGPVEIHPVGNKEPNTAGLYDMHGNAAELCLDGYGPYSGGSQVDPLSPDVGLGRVTRGGSAGMIAQHCRSAIRFAEHPTSPTSRVGFRVVLSPTHN